MYIVCKQFNNKGISGFISLNKGKQIEVIDDYLCHNNKRICYIKSQNAYDYFANNDDNKGLIRYEKTHQIKDIFKELITDYNNQVANIIQENSEATEEELNTLISQVEDKAREFIEETNISLNSYEFYNASIEKLDELLSIISKKYKGE